MLCRFVNYHKFSDFLAMGNLYAKKNHIFTAQFGPNNGL